MVKVVQIFFVALGIVLGAATFGGLAALIMWQRPILTMTKIAEQMKIWAMVAAIGGTFNSIEVLESGIFKGNIMVVIKQILYIVVAVVGAHLGYRLLLLITGVHE